jgi:hypothetical protein
MAGIARIADTGIHDLWKLTAFAWMVEPYLRPLSKQMSPIAVGFVLLVVLVTTLGQK